MDKNQLDRIQELAWAYCDGELDRQGLQQLEQLLSQGDPAIREYHHCLSMHAKLTHNFGGVNRTTGRPTSDRLVGTATSKAAKHTRWAAGLLALAASLVAVVMWIQPQSPEETPQFTARVIDKIDCDWESERWGMETASEFDSGQVVNIGRGLMVVEFGDGALVTLEGPAQFEVVSASRGFLHSGKLTAQVPERAHGFIVGTPSYESVDLGTEFGLKVLEDGTAETHVFEGEVILKKHEFQEGGFSEDLHLTTDMAALVDGESLELAERRARPNAFVRFDQNQPPPPLSEPAKNGIPSGKGLVLWLDANLGVQTDEQGRVSSWDDLLYDDNRRRENAWQVRPPRRPRLVQDGINGRPAINFDGKQFLVTAPLATGNDVTFFCVFECHRHDIAKQKAAMLINFNGPPNIVVSRSWRDELMGRMYSGLTNEQVMHGSWLKAPGLEEEKPTLVTYVYNASEDKSRLYGNGRLLSEGGAAASAATDSPKYIGRHRESKGYFVGNIGEIAIFNAALTPQECQQVAQYLLGKYSIDPDESFANEAAGE